MKNSFFIVRKKTILILLAVIIVLSAVITFSVKTVSSMPKSTHVIVIDAGHGGRDGGTSGVSTGVSESELNLTYAKKLAGLCEQFGIKAVLTRKDMNGLYDDNAANKKKSEMEKRKKIINESGGEIMISIHMNSFPLSSCKGAQVFYAKGSEGGQSLAKSVQTNISQSFDSARDYVTVGDYYVINTANMPAILIECGFLSNPEEERLLASDDYCEKFCYSILAGIISYFEM